VTSIDAQNIKSWEEFEYVLAVIIENRLLQVYQGHLDKEYQKKWRKLDQELLSYAEEPLMQEKKPEKQKPKKNKKKRPAAIKKPEADENIRERNVLEEYS
jgi:hypothetical protein